MKPDELNDWLGVITNLGVIAGLFLVAYEVNQTSISMDREYRSWRTTVSQQQQQMWVDWTEIVTSSDNADVWFRGSMGEELTPAEQSKFDRLTTTYFFLFFNMYTSFETIEPGTARFNPSVEIKDKPGLIRALNDLCKRYKLDAFCDRSLQQVRQASDDS